VGRTQFDSKSLINISPSGAGFVRISMTILNFMFNDRCIIPARLLVYETGKVIYEMAELDDLYKNDYDELEHIAELLR